MVGCDNIFTYPHSSWGLCMPFSQHCDTYHAPHTMEIFIPVDNFGTVVGENPTPYGILALWAVNSLSIVYWDLNSMDYKCQQGYKFQKLNIVKTLKLKEVTLTLLIFLWNSHKLLSLIITESSWWSCPYEHQGELKTINLKGELLMKVSYSRLNCNSLAQ